MSIYIRSAFLILFGLLNLSLRAEIKIVNTQNASNPTLCDGSIKVEASGSAAPFFLTLRLNGNIIATADFINGSYTFEELCPGDYIVTVQNSQGCSQNLSATIIVCVVSASSIAGVVHPSCFGTESGGIDISIGTGTMIPPYSFYWSNGAITQNLINVSAGTYAVVIQDGRGCTQRKTFVVESSEITLEDYHVEYNNQAGTASIFAEAETSHPDLTFDWYLNGNLISSDNPLQNVANTTYELVITNHLGCELRKTFDLNGCETVNLDLSVEQSSLYPSPGVSIYLTVQNFTEPLSYEWAGPNNFESDTKDLIGVAAQGEYCVTVRDGCYRKADICTNINCGETPKVWAENQCLENWLFDPGWVKASLPESAANNETPCDDRWELTFEIIRGGSTFISSEVKILSLDDDALEFRIRDELDQAGGHVNVYIKNLSCTGCDNGGSTPAYRFNFSEHAIDVSKAYVEPIGNVIPGYPEPFWSVATGCATCKVCTAQFQGPGTWSFDECVDPPVVSEFNYTNIDPNRPCTGGSISCPGDEIQIDPNLQGEEIVRWDLPPTIGADGMCVYKMGCLFPPGLVSTDPSALLFVQWPFGKKTQAQIGGEPCIPPVPPGCNGFFVIDPAGTRHPDDPCLVKRICTTDPNVWNWLGTSNICRCNNEGGTCFVVKTCFTSERIDCESSEFVEILSDDCEGFSDPFYGEIYPCAGHTGLPGKNALQRGYIKEVSNISVVAYPVPFSSFLMVDIVTEEHETLTISMKNIYGQTIRYDNSLISNGELNVWLDTEGISPGLYFLEVETRQNGRVVLSIPHISR